MLANCQLTEYNQSGGAGRQACFSITDLDVEGQSVKFRITLRTRSNPQGGRGTLTFDNFGAAFQSLTNTPVSFTSFAGKKTKNGVQLTWHVADEVNVKAYEVERSTKSNSSFARIGSVAATGASSYSFTDAAFQSGTVYYRIKNVDNDGKFKYSNTVSFDKGAGTVAVRVLPTVVSSRTTVEHGVAKGAETLTISTTDGRVVRSLRPVTGSVKTTVELSDLQSGLYLLKWNDGNTVETIKIVKQ